MAGSYYGQVHKENLKRTDEFYKISRKNKYRKCKVVEKVKTLEGVKELEPKRALFHGWFQEREDSTLITTGTELKQVAAGARVRGIVEYMDGTVELVAPESIKFLDTKAYRELCDR